MKFVPDSTFIRTILMSYPIMKIPNFQRDYSWEKKYYSAFLDDILNELNIEDGKLVNTEYFIGTMVFSKQKGKNYLEVIDGQQRLTVITILLSVISSKFKYIIKNDGLSNATFKYIKTKDDYDQPIVKLKTATSYPYFEGYIQSNEKQDLSPSSIEEEKIAETYNYFDSQLDEEKVRKKLGISKDIDYTNILTAIRDQILSMNVISIITEDKESSYEIFEILNAKGMNLSSIDLIKNTIFSEFHCDENTRDKIIERDWEEIKKILRDRNQNIGFITFYRHFWISKYKKTTNIKLYDSFKEMIPLKQNDIDENESFKSPNKEVYQEFVKTLKNEANNYLKIVCPNRSDYNDKKQFYWLIQSFKAIEKIFGVSQARIALLALIDVKERRLIQNKSFKRSIKCIENFIFAYSTLLKNQANIYESIFSNFAIELRKTNSIQDSDKILEKYLFSIFQTKFPQKDEFIQAFKNLSYSKDNRNQSNLITRYVLNNICSKFDNRDIYYDDSSIEHIINEDKSVKETLNIGNLICLETTLNEEAGNLDFDEKVEIYKKSKYGQVKEFCNKYKTFKLKDFIKRSEELAEYYYNIIIPDDLKCK